MSTLRRLNEKGVDEFRAYIALLTEGDTSDPPYGLLSNPATSSPIEPSISLERRSFETKRAAGEWLADCLSSFPEAELFTDTGLWSALSLWFFEDLAPADSVGRRSPGRDVYYIPSGAWNRDYRHKLLAPYRVYTIHGEGARLILEEKPAVHGDWMEQLASRMEVVTSPTVMATLDRMYFDERRNAPRRGAQTRNKPGTVRRFVEVLQQLDLTYDVYALESDRLLDLLPPEFDRFRM